MLSMDIRLHGSLLMLTRELVSVWYTINPLFSQAYCKALEKESFPGKPAKAKAKLFKRRAETKGPSVGEVGVRPGDLKPNREAHQMLIFSP